MKKSKRVIWGLIFVAAALLLLASNMGYLHGIGFSRILFSTICGILIIGGIINKSFASFLFGAAFMCIVWDKELGIEQITPWPILGAALLLSIGLSMIFGGSKKRHHWEYHYIPKGQNYDDGERIFCETKFGGSEKYIDSPNLVSVDIVNKCGGSAIYMDKAIPAGDTVVVRVHCKCGGVEIYVPKSWKIDNQVDCVLGTVDISRSKDCVNDVTMILTGTVKLGGIEIIRV